MRATAICPTYNRRQYIPQMIACFLSQTFTDSELIIVDDGTDSIADLIPENPRIKYIRLEGPRRTTGLKRNIACEQAQGAFILHFDDDDWSAPGRIAHQIAALESSGKQVLTYHNMLYWNVDTQKLYRYHPTKIGTPYGASFCYFKNWWKQHPFIDKMVGEDTDFGWQAINTGQFLVVDAEKFLILRAHGSNTCINATFQGAPDIPQVKPTELPTEFLLTLGSTMPKLLVAIKTCFKPNYKDPKNANAIDYRDRSRCFDSEKRREALRTTWLTEFTNLGVDYKFFFGRPPLTQIEPNADEVFLDCGDTYFDISRKFKAMCQWALDHGYEYMLLTDDDVFIYPDRLLQTDWAKFDYSGHECCDFLIGCCVFFSRAALEIMASSPITHWMEDAWCGQALRPKGILPHLLPNMHCFLGDRYNIDPSKIPTRHAWSVLHVCSPETIKIFWERGKEPLIEPPPPIQVVSEPKSIPAVPNMTPPPQVASPKPKRAGDGLTVDWWDTPAGKKMRAEQ
jgi:glycosyltransferase involved in cell wall biosynthesis